MSESSVMVASWLQSIINPVHKNGEDPRNPLKGYWGISLCSTVYKVYCDVLNQRLSIGAERKGFLSEEQNGFRKGRSCLEHIFSLTTLVKHKLVSKRPVYACFIDAKKAFDRVNRTLLQYRLLCLGVTGRMYNAIKSLYQNVTSCVRINGYYTDWFDVAIGVKQGCLLSPLLFALFIDDLCTKLKGLSLGVQFGVEKLSLLLYADDIVILAENAQDLQVMLNVVYSWCYKWRIELNCQKSRVIHFRTQCPVTNIWVLFYMNTWTLI